MERVPVAVVVAESSVTEPVKEPETTGSSLVPVIVIVIVDVIAIVIVMVVVVMMVLVVAVEITSARAHGTREVTRHGIVTRDGMRHGM